MQQIKLANLIVQPQRRVNEQHGPRTRPRHVGLRRGAPGRHAELDGLHEGAALGAQGPPVDLVLLLYVFLSDNYVLLLINCSFLFWRRTPSSSEKWPVLCPSKLVDYSN